MPARLLLRADHEAAAAALATAFADDPMATWLVGAPDAEAQRNQGIVGFFGPGLAAGATRGHMYGLGPVGGPLDAVALWSPPDVPMFTEAEGGALGAAVVGAAAPKRSTASSRWASSPGPATRTTGPTSTSSCSAPCARGAGSGVP